MKYYNLKLAVFLKEDLNNLQSYEKISNFIFYSMLKNPELKELHEKNEYKNYVFCNLYPVEKDSFYRANNFYTFDIRGIELYKMLKLKQVLENSENDIFKVIQINFQTNMQRNISKLITLTPAIITTKKGDYDIRDDMFLVKNRILANAQKKYKNLYDVNIDIDFIENIKKLNRTPVKIPYKNINILGNKFEIEVKQDPMSQNLAYLILSTGILEKNSLGFGFCMAR